MSILGWLQANAGSIWFGLCVLIVGAAYLYKRYNDNGQNAERFAQALLNEAIAGALIVVRGAADQIKREDMDVIVAFLYIRVPVWVEAVFPLALMQEKAWEAWLKIHEDLDVQRKAQIIGLVNKSRSVRVKA